MARVRKATASRPKPGMPRASLEPVLIISGATYAALALGTLLVPSITKLRRIAPGKSHDGESQPAGTNT